MYLNCHSFHSLRYGTIPLNELVEQAVSLNVKSLALTDIHTVTGIYDFYKACIQVGIKPLVGMEFRAANTLLYLGLAKNAAGIAEMCHWLTEHNLTHTPLPTRPPDFKHTFVLYPITHIPTELRSHEFVGIRLCELQRMFPRDIERLLPKLVILHPVTFRTKKEFNLHRILRAMAANTLLSKQTPADYCQPTEYMLPEDTLRAGFKGYPQLIRNTENLIAKCNYEFEFGVSRNKKYYTGSKSADCLLLANLAQTGCVRRYGKNHLVAQARVANELKVISDLNFSSYFLITWDIIRYSNSLGFMHVGRGSGANSIVSYCLGITDICPIELDLYFERFLNEHRKSPPDFDLDWSWRERDVILDYVFKRFGAAHVAFCGTNVAFKYRSIFREVGKVFGLAKAELDELAKQRTVDQHDNAVVRLVTEYGILLEKYPNQRSMHSCGIIISEEPITNYTVLEMPPKGFPIVLFDMYVAEDIGFDKFDILSQRGLGTIGEAVKLVEENRGIKIDIGDVSISKNEIKCNEMLSLGQTIGCFYIESPAMRGLLRRLRCDNYKTLVAASSIIRPGVAQSGMMREYIFRHNNPTDFEYFHEVFERELGETYGVMVYQEDVIKIALHYGGLPAAYGDILRRAISGKSRSITELQVVKEQFLVSCKRKGHPEELSQEVYRQIESFAGYSFCKAHSASYAVESYQSLYLKAYYGVEFMVAAINNRGGFYRTEVYIHEAKMNGAKIHNPCVNKSEVDATVCGKDVYLGLSLLKGLHNDFITSLISERECGGEFVSLDNFVERVAVGIESLQTLIFIGAFRFTRQSKSELLVRGRQLLVRSKSGSTMPSLLQVTKKVYKLPVLQHAVYEDAFDEIELLSFPVSCSPFDLLQTKFRGDVFAKDLLKFVNREVRMLAYLVSTKQVPTKQGMMYFGTWIDVAGDYFDTAHFPKSLQEYRFQGGGCYLLLGTVTVDYHFPTVTIKKMAKMPFIPDPRYEVGSEQQFEVYEKIKEDQSNTYRKPYPQEHEIGLPRGKMGNGNT